MTGLDPWIIDALLMLYLDFTNAFGSVSIPKLLFKLVKLGFKQAAMQWLANFTMNRKQQIMIQNVLSEEVLVTSGVAQGSVIGGILFAIYTCDVVKYVNHSEISIYADDTKLYRNISSSDDCELLQTDLDSINAWSNTWQLKLNPSKCKSIRIGYSDSSWQYKLGDYVLENCDHIKDLGVTFSSGLSFKLHVNDVVRKCQFICHNIFLIFKGHSLDFYKKLYTTYVLPLIDYASPVWFQLNVSEMTKLESIQRKFSKRIPGLHQLDYDDRLDRMDLCTIQRRLMLCDQMYLYKIINNIVEINLDDSFIIRPTFRSHNLQLYKFFCRTERRKCFYINRVVDVWNGLSVEIVNSENLGRFKSLLMFENL